MDTKHFSPEVAPIEELRDGKLNILFVGRPEKRKGLSHLLKAYKRVKEVVPETRLIIVGPGTREKYEGKVSKNGLKDVVFAGYTTYDELPRYYKTADIYCSPATGYESFGIVLLEGMALGKPVVASNIDGYASVLSDGVEGLLVPPKDEKSLAQALIKLLRDETLRQKMGANGLVKAKEYDWDNIVRRLLDYYSEVIKKSRNRETFSLRKMIIEDLGKLFSGKVRGHAKNKSIS